ncbi:hypothetical protein BO94DRAFT_622268 [Aspergillus sclerotioniger CBS 115572]|uniref:Uncharacterized protein n=1 Tax=Aspergillus sclerotioniger CBS 115572 TaxID=1450535 RepID=A0A317X946_9EURO|nr:hypothetical protein BO94DRAFT_622268 [Aspergillus sclerotioniger CBS 115572]PWY93080.1 hypothetical protein BO94DRAFT_622268 [Aspergillus sclerotioniger CBS 115572]
MSAQPRKASGQYHLTGSDIVESIDDLGSTGQWEDLNRRAHQATEQSASAGQQGTGSHRAPDRNQSFRLYQENKGAEEDLLHPDE